MHLEPGVYNRTAIQRMLRADQQYLDRVARKNYSVPSTLGNLPMNNYITQLYLTLLQRVPSSGEISSWVNSKASKEQMLRAFLNSPEYLALSR